MIVKEHERAAPYSRERAKTTEELIGFIVHQECVKALESELAKLLPDYGRDDLDRLRETY